MARGGAAARLKGRELRRWNDAVSYILQVKHEFLYQPEVYDDFIQIMKDFRSHRIDIPGVVQRVANLFRDHPVWIDGFNVFLPPRYRIPVPVPDEHLLNAMVERLRHGEGRF